MMTVIGTPSSHSMIGIVFLLMLKLVIEKPSQPSREMRDAPFETTFSRGGAFCWQPGRGPAASSSLRHRPITAGSMPRRAHRLIRRLIKPLAALCG